MRSVKFVANKTYVGTTSKEAQNRSPITYVSTGSDINGEILATWIELTLCTDTVSSTGKRYNLYITLWFGDTSRMITSAIQWNGSTTGHTTTITWTGGLTLEEANSITALQVGCAETGIYITGTQRILIEYLQTPSITNVGSPTSFTVSTTKTTSNTITLTWSGASSGTGNSISGYLIEYQDSSNNSSWGSWYSLKTVSSSSSSGSTTASLPSARKYRRFRIKTLGTVSGYDATTYRQSSSVLRTSIPSTPSNFTAAPEEWDSGPITLSWNASSATGQTISRYNIEYRVQKSGETYGSWQSLASTGSITYSHTPSISAGDAIQYRVRAYSSDGYYSSYSSIATVTAQEERSLYVGVDSVARLIDKIYVGVDGTAREISEAYVGIDNKAYRFY